MRILLVEDDAELGSGVCASLKREHYAVDWVTDGPSASTALSTGQYDLVILDLGLPKMSGCRCCGSCARAVKLRRPCRC